MIVNGLNWDVDLVRGLFVDEEADIIIGIPLSLSNRDDRYVYKFSEDGKFSVTTIDDTS